MFRLLTFCSLLGIATSLAFSNPQVKRNTSITVVPRNVSLRVLPLGDSITNGFGSTDGNGYRDFFVELAEQGGPVQMIGSETGFGLLPDEQEEGWDGYDIDQISAKATNALKAEPNLVLLLAGTNNMNNGTQAAGAPADMEALVDKILAGSTRAVLLVGTIPPSTWIGRQPLNDEYNAALETIVSSRQDAGKHILLVPIAEAVWPTNLFDGLHPNDVSYLNMSVTWVESVNDAQNRGWFQAPDPGNGTVAPSTNFTVTPANDTSASGNGTSTKKSGATTATFGAWWHHTFTLVAILAATTPWLGLEI